MVVRVERHGKDGQISGGGADRKRSCRRLMEELVKKSKKRIRSEKNEKELKASQLAGMVVKRCCITTIINLIHETGSIKSL